MLSFLTTDVSELMARRYNSKLAAHLQEMRRQETVENWITVPTLARFCRMTWVQGVREGGQPDTQATLCLQCCPKKYDFKRKKSTRSMESLASHTFFLHEMKRALSIFHISFFTCPPKKA